MGATGAPGRVPGPVGGLPGARRRKARERTGTSTVSSGSTAFAVWPAPWSRCRVGVRLAYPYPVDASCNSDTSVRPRPRARAAPGEQATATTPDTCAQARVADLLAPPPRTASLFALECARDAAVQGSYGSLVLAVFVLTWIPTARPTQPARHVVCDGIAVVERRRRPEALCGVAWAKLEHRWPATGAPRLARVGLGPGMAQAWPRLRNPSPIGASARSDFTSFRLSQLDASRGANVGAGFEVDKRATPHGFASVMS